MRTGEAGAMRALYHGPHVDAGATDMSQMAETTR